MAARSRYRSFERWTAAAVAGGDGAGARSGSMPAGRFFEIRRARPSLGLDLLADPSSHLRHVEGIFGERPVGLFEPCDLEPILCRGTAAGGPFWYTRTNTTDPEYVKSKRPDMIEWFRFSGVYHFRFDSLRAVAVLDRVGFGVRTEGHYEEFGPFNNGIGGARLFEWDPPNYPGRRSSHMPSRQFHLSSSMYVCEVRPSSRCVAVTKDSLPRRTT